MTTANIGINPGLATLPYAAATKRTKQYNLTVAVSGTNVANPTYPGAVGIAYADSSGNWRLRFNITCRFNSATIGNLTVNVTGVTFSVPSNTAMAVLAKHFGANPDNSAYTTAGGGDIQIEAPSTASITGVYLSGDVPLSSEPTWAAANMEGALPVDVYIPAASASETGLVNTGAQSFAGVKTFTNGISLGNETLSVYDEGSFTARFNLGMNDDNTDVIVRYVRIGNHVTLAFPDARVTVENTTALWYTAQNTLPASITPSITRIPTCAVQYNNNAEVGTLTVAATGDLYLVRNGGANWVAGTTNCGFYLATCSYLLNN